MSSGAMLPKDVNGIALLRKDDAALREGGHLVLTSSYPRWPGDPSGHFVHAEVQALRSGGHEVRVLAPGASVVGSEFAARGLGGSSLFGFPGAIPRLRAAPWRALVLPFVLLRATRALLVAPEKRWHAHFLVPFGLLASILAPNRGARVVLVGHGSDVRLILRLPPLAKRLVARILRRSRAELRFVSEELRSAFLAAPEFSALAGKTRVEAAAIEIPVLPDKAEARKLVGFGSDETVAVIVGRLVPEKRVEVALRALALIGARVLVVGDGSEKARLESAFPEVEFRGLLPRNEALLLVRAADLLVSASTLEGAPTAIREARALGTAVIAVDCGDLRVWARDDDGLQVIAPTPAAFAPP